MQNQLFIAHMFELNSNPTAHSNVRRPVELLRVCFDQRRLHANRRRYSYRNVTIIVMVIGKHCIDLLAHEERRFSVRQLLCRLRKGRTDSPDPFDMFRALIGLLLLCSLFQVKLLAGSALIWVIIYLTNHWERLPTLRSNDEFDSGNYFEVGLISSSSMASRNIGNVCS